MWPSRDTGATDKAQSVTGRYRVAGSDRNRISFHVPVLRVCPISMGHNYRIADGVEVPINIPIIAGGIIVLILSRSHLFQ